MTGVTAPAAPVPPGAVRRVVTGHDDRGRAVVRSDAMLDGVTIPGGDARFALVWTTDRSPADNRDAADGGLREVGLTSPDGSVFRIVDMAPGRRSPMHRTHSVDYGLVLFGEIELELDDGVVTLLRAGDTVVQRGTVHAWVNRTDQWCRIAFVLIDAEPLPATGT